MLARFTTADDPAALLRSAWLRMDAPTIDISNDGGRTWQYGRDLAEFVASHPAALTAPRQTVRRLAGNRIQWMLTIKEQQPQQPPPPPTPAPQLAPRPAAAGERQQAMDIDKLYPSKYLSPDDLRGRSVLVTVAQVTVEELYNPRGKEKQRKAVLHFAGKEKVLPCNKTQALALAQISGSRDTEAWPGFRIVLSPGLAPNRMPTITITAPEEAKAAPKAAPAAPAPAAPPARTAQEEANDDTDRYDDDDDDEDAEMNPPCDHGFTSSCPEGCN